MGKSGYITKKGKIAAKSLAYRLTEFSLPFFVALGELRATFGTHVAALAYQYGIDIEGELASILSSADEAL